MVSTNRCRAGLDFCAVDYDVYDYDVYHKDPLSLVMDASWQLILQPWSLSNAMPHNIVFHSELVEATAFIAHNATVLGDVRVGTDASIWFGCVIRGDTEGVRIGAQTNIQDLSVLHADPGCPCILGARVTVGHAAVVHGATVEDDVMIGMRAVVLNGATIGTGSVIAAGCVVPEGLTVPPRSLLMGVPGKVKCETSAAMQARILQAAQHYVDLVREYRERQ